MLERKTRSSQSKNNSHSIVKVTKCKKFGSLQSKNNSHSIIKVMKRNILADLYSNAKQEFRNPKQFPLCSKSAKM